MAQIIEDILVIKFSKLVKNQEENVQGITSTEIQQAIEQVAQELVGDGIIVEVERA